MKQQKYPETKIKVGATIFKVTAWTDCDGKTQTDIEPWVIRSIQRKRGTATRWGVKCRLAEFHMQRYVNMTYKDEGISWVRLSRKVGHFGWAKSIPRSHRRQFPAGYDLPCGFYTTILAALKYALQDKETTLKRYVEWQAEETEPSEVAEWDESIADAKKELRALKTRLNKLIRGK